MNKEVENIINELTPLELNKVKRFVDELLNIKPNSRLTNLEYLQKNKKVSCPNDKNHSIKKNGHWRGTQRYYCKNCKKSFSITNKSITNKSILNYNKILNILKGFYDYRPLREIALDVGISTTSLFELQIKIFYTLNEIYKVDKLSEVVQVDEMYILVSFKGTKKDKMPRKSRKNGINNETAGMGLDHVCVIVAIDSNDNIILEISDLGSANKEQIFKVLDNRIKENSILVTDSKNAYQNFAKKNNLKLVQIPSGNHMKDGYTINDVNQIMQEISIYISNKRGVSSKHLQQHLNFIKYRKKIKYTIEYLEINEQMYKDAILLPISLKSNDVYFIDLPFDIDDYVEWHTSHKRS